MSDDTVRQAKSAPVGGVRRFRVGAVIALAAAVGLILWLVLRDNGSNSGKGVSATDLQSLATSVGHPIFWIGEQKGNTYELTKKSDGSIVVRYLPPGVSVGAQGEYWSVATYPFPGAFEAIKKVSKESGVTTIKLADDGLAEYANTNLNNVHAAYPGVNYQIEIFAPARQAAALVRAGRLDSFGGPKGGTAEVLAPKPKAATLARLATLANSLGHPLYWAGPKSGYTYELTRTSDGKVSIRYLPPGAQLGSAQPYLSVGTYPFPGALAAIRRVAKEKNQTTFKAPGGALGVFDIKNPKNVHFAYPGSDYQIEVFDPAGKARQVVASGGIASIG